MTFFSIFPAQSPMHSRKEWEIASIPFPSLTDHGRGSRVLASQGQREEYCNQDERINSYELQDCHPSSKYLNE
jgi:hypothetical protein